MGGRYTFTAGQWEELEVQAMIYKYMVASLPVPYQLLLPIIQSQSQSLLPFPLRYSSSSKEEEVGRCKRTDGKKWRCSRDVAAPNHKYCERHMHRGRPRSRKHVELSNNQSLSTSKSTNGGSTTTTTILPSSSSATTHPFFLHNNIIMQSNKRGCDWSSEVGSASASIFNNNDYFYGRGDFNLSLGNTREVSNPLAEVLVGGGVSSSSTSPYPTPTPTATGGDDGVVSPSASQRRRRRRMLLSDGNNNTPTLVTTLPFQ